MVLSMKSKPRALRAERERKGHTLTSLAPLTGLSKQRLWQLESEPSGILPTNAKQVAEALGVGIEDIFLLSDEPESESVA